MDLAKGEVRFEPLEGADTESLNLTGLSDQTNAALDQRRSGASLDERDIDLLARTIIGEAASEPEKGKAAVASVVINRLNSGKYGQSMEEVLFSKNQFEPWTNPQTRKRLMSISPSNPDYKKARQIAEAVARGEVPDFTNGALNFANPDVVRKYHRTGKASDSTLNWVSDIEQNGVRIGNHVFGTPGRGGNVSAAQKSQVTESSTDNQMGDLFKGNGAAEEIFNERAEAAGYNPEDISFSSDYDDPMLSQDPGYRLSVAGEPFDISKFEKAETREEFDRLMSIYGPDMTEAEKDRLSPYRESLPAANGRVSEDVQKYMAAGYQQETAEKLALGTLQLVKDEVTKQMYIVDMGTGKRYLAVDLMNQGTGEATDGVSTEGEETSDALDIDVPDDFDPSAASSKAQEISSLSPEQRTQEITALESELQNLADGTVEGFEATLRNIDLGSALGIKGIFGNVVNKGAGAIGVDAPRPKTRTASAALERLQRLSALTLAQAQTNQRGSVYLLEMLQANDISPNEFIGVDGALEKFEANYSLISDRVRDLEKIGSGKAKVKPGDVSRANAVLPSLKRLQSYYGALVANASERASERANGEDERPLILVTPGDGSDPKRIPDGAVDMLLNGVKDESTREEFMGAFDRKFGAGKAQEVLDAYK
jgi:spore germination cell wall hydrolase CwlJ-like protein